VQLHKYKFVRVLKLSNNALTTIEEVGDLEFLLELQAKNNQITNIDFMSTSEMNHLQKVNLMTNKITSLP